MKGPVKSLILGVFILSAITVFVGVILFLKPTVGNGEQILYIRFSDIGRLNVGTRVLFAGKPVGEVTSLEKIKNARNQPTDELGRVYFYQLTVHVDSDIDVFNTDEVSIQTSGLMGEKSISITPKAPPKGITPKKITDQPIYANSVDMLQNAMLDFSDLSASMEDSFNRLTSWITDHGEEVATTIRAAGAALEEIDQAIASYNKLDVISDVKVGLQEFGTTLAQLQGAITELKDRNAFANTGTMIKNLKSASAQVDVICEDICLGKGTLGKLIVDDDIYLQANAVMSKVNNLMNDVNQYGVLFHLNKQWQRTHLQKISELNALNSPQSFRNYFESEVSEINSSMTRISMLIQKAEYAKEKKEILQSPAFRRDFAELLRRADSLSDTLRLYNQQFNAALGD